MFMFCYNLLNVPANRLPAPTLASGCSYAMLYDCPELTDIGNIDTDGCNTRTNNQQASVFNNDTNIATPITYANIPTGWK
jgi:hypothetical protein